MIAETIDIATADGAADAFYARPDDNGPYPGVVLYTDAFGNRPAAHEHVKRLAKSGYCVLAPNVFYRSRRAPVLDNLAELMASEDRSALFAQLRPMIDLVTPEAAHSDSVAWLEFLRSQQSVADRRIGTVGYCMGGRLSLRMAGRVPRCGGCGRDVPRRQPRNRGRGQPASVSSEGNGRAVHWSCRQRPLDAA